MIEAPENDIEGYFVLSKRYVCTLPGYACAPRLRESCCPRSSCRCQMQRQISFFSLYSNFISRCNLWGACRQAKIVEKEKRNKHCEILVSCSDRRCNDVMHVPSLKLKVFQEPKRVNSYIFVTWQFKFSMRLRWCFK